MLKVVRSSITPDPVVEAYKPGPRCFTLVTSLGDIDLLGEIPGGGTYEELSGGAIRLNVFGKICLCLSLSQLIRAKRAAGRPKDLEALAKLEAIDEEQSDSAQSIG